ncbi:MAG: iron complex outermembrane receptor protein [Limisphaerales bacterium]|jgi:iron complex outermembrane receptor protein
MRLHLLLALLFVGLLLPGIGDAVGSSYPAGALRDNLLTLAQEQRLSIFFAEEDVSKLQVPEIADVASIPLLLETWLEPHCLVAEFIRERFVTISKVSICGDLIEPIKTVPVRAEVPIPQSHMEEILVRDLPPTGSRLKQASFGRAMPLDVIDQQEILLSGMQSVSELLRYVPAVSGNSTSTLISNGGDGSASITLRGLPASNTLVLLNGRRTNFNAISGASVDLNALPLSMIERIEILKDGVSAIYGSDAIAGVVNIITKRGVDGFDIDAYRGQSAKGDLQTTQVSLHGGFQDDVWYGSVNLSSYKQEGIFSRNRSLSASSDDRNRGGIDRRSSAIAPALVTSATGSAFTLTSGLPGTNPTDFRVATDEDRFEYRDYTSSVVPLERLSFYSTLGLIVNDRWQTGLDIFVSHTEADTQLAPVPIFTGFETIPLVVAANNPFNPFNEDQLDVRRRVVELSSRRQHNDSTSYQTVLHSKYENDSLILNFNVQHDRTHAVEYLRNGLHAGRLAQSLGDGCIFPCVPFNLFGDVGSITPEMLRWAGANAQIEGTSSLTGATADVDWQSQSTDIALAAGVEFRREKLRIDPDQTLRDGQLIGGGNRGRTSGSRNVAEIYGEIYVPIIKRAQGPAKLSMQLAARYSKYTDFGNVTNPRLVILWNPTEQWNIRGSIGKGFRAPTLPQLHGSVVQSFQQLNDPCSAADASVLAGCSNQSDASLNQFLTINGGDTTLKPERSVTTSIGVSWEGISEFGNHGVAVDLFSISQEDVVESSAQYIVNLNARTGAFADRVGRDANGNLNRVHATLQNIGSRDVQGMDLSGHLQFESEHWGRLLFALDATHIASFRDKFDPDTPSEQKAGTFSDEASTGLGSLPDWKVSLASNLNFKQWQVHYSVYWISSLEETIPLSTARRTISDWMTHNMNVSYFGPWTAWVRTTLGVQNLFDEQPPFSAAAFNDSYDGRTYDITGRYFFVKFDRAF